MVSYLHLDFESRAVVELSDQKSVGLYNYWNHAETRPLMLAYAYDEEPPELWQMHESFMPDKLRKGLEDEDQMLAAFNSPFERYALKYKLQIDTPIKRWADPQASGRYLSLPASLDKVGIVLNLPLELAKDKRGEALIDLFCKPHKKRKKRGEQEEQYWNDQTTHPVEWREFCNYCQQDVIAERELMHRMSLLKVFPLPPFEREIWEFDQLVNDRGMPVDVQFVKNAYQLADRSKKEAIAKQNQLTGLENANSPKQMLAWAKTQGYKPNTLNKDVVANKLKNCDTLTPVCREVLEARKSASSTTYKKLSTVLRQVSPDGRLRNLFTYMGSSRCGRWSSTALQFHNMSRPGTIKNNGLEFNFEDEDILTEARQLVYQNDYDAIQAKYGSVLLVIKFLIRTIFSLSGNDERFNVTDLNAIETRVGAWVSQCKPLMDVFIPTHGKPNGNCPYLNFAVNLTGISYEKLERDYHSIDKLLKAIAKGYRQWAKAGVLGCIYRLGGGDEFIDEETEDIFKTGLMSYAEGYGVQLTKEQADQIVRVFRDSYKEIPQMWYDLEKAISDVLAGQRVKRELGPNGCIKIDKLTRNSNGDKRYILRIQLPSGRYLHYIDAEMMSVQMPWKDREGKDVYKDSLCYSGIDQETHIWKMGITSHGGKVFENIVQGIARDVLAVKLLEFEKIGISIVGHVHDEGIGLTPNDAFYPGAPEMINIMSQPISWAPGLLLGADGFEGNFYHK